MIDYATEAFQPRVEQTGACFRSYSPDFAFARNGGPRRLTDLMLRSIETAEVLLPQLLDASRATGWTIC